MSKRVALETIELAVDDRGAGVPVVFVHGFPLNHSMWSKQLDALSGTMRTIAPDLRGFGGSTVVPGTVTMAQFADDLAGMLDAMQIAEPIVLCGLSMGGYIAWEFVRRHRSRLRGLILCDTRAAPDTPEAAQGRLKTAEQVLRLGAESIAEAMQPKLFSELTMKQRPEIVAAVREMIVGTNTEGIAAAQRGMASRADSAPLLNLISLPTLVICGVEDRITPEDEMRQVASQIAGAKFVSIADAGHLSPMEEPEQVNRAISDFVGAT